MEKEKQHIQVKGFTIMEVIVVIAILGALTALALPKFTGVLANSQLKTDYANVRIVDSAVELYRAEKDALPTDIDSFDGLVTKLYDEGYLKNASITSVSGGSFSYNSISGVVAFSPEVK